MPNPNESTHRLRHRATGEEVSVRNAEEVDDGEDMMEVRMPIASTGEVRNEGDDPLSRDELRGMARQLSDREIGVFPAHGDDTMIAAGRYSPFEKLGVWTDAEIDAREDTNLLMATARMPDPETLPEATGSYRQALAILKEQAQRGIAQDASIGWRTDADGPGGVDLMEASIVGIGADPRTNTGDEAAEVVAREAVAAGADPDDLVARVAAAVESRAERAVVTVNGEEIDITPPEAVVNAVEAALTAKEEYADALGECGTGDGEESARRIRDDDLTAEYVADEIAAYLTSHAEDVDGITDPPTDWDRETWTDGCGPVQYALWGGTATGTGRDWAQGVANAVAEANDEEVPYPERAVDSTDTQSDDMTDTDDPADDGGTDEQVQDAPDDEGETTERAPDDLTEDRLATFAAVHYDGMDEGDIMALAEEQGAEFLGTTDVEELYDLVSVVTGAEYDAVESAMSDLVDTNEIDDDEEDDDEEDDEDDEAEQSADTDDDDERDLADEVAALREEVDELREGGLSPDDVETPDSDAEQSVDEDDGTEQRDTTDDDSDDRATAGPNWRGN